MPPKKKVRLFVGNPGVGKSTILNGLIGRTAFRSGVEIGEGLTKALQLETAEDGIIYGDTPGLSDMNMRKLAATSISAALKQDGEYQLIFVVTLESGRVRPDDVTTIKLVLDAIDIKDNIAYSVVVNKVGPTVMKHLKKSGAAEKLMALLNQHGLQPTTSIHAYPHVPSLDDVDDAVVELNSDFVSFMQIAPTMVISPLNVGDISHASFDEVTAQLTSVIEDLRKDKARMEELLEKNREMHRLQFESLKKAMDMQSESARRELLRLQSEVKNAHEAAETHRKNADMIDKKRSLELDRLRADSARREDTLNSRLVAMANKVPVLYDPECSDDDATGGLFMVTEEADEDPGGELMFFPQPPERSLSQTLALAQEGLNEKGNGKQKKKGLLRMGGFLGFL